MRYDAPYRKREYARRWMSSTENRREKTERSRPISSNCPGSTARTTSEHPRNKRKTAVAAEVVRIVTGYISTGQVHNAVNRLDQTPAQFILAVHHRNRVGVLAEVLTIVKQNGINVDAMENVLFQGGEGACANIQIESALSAQALATIEAASEDIFSVTMHEIA